MNDTQWVFELWSMNKQDEEKFKEMDDLVKVVEERVVSALGLNLMPVEDATTKLLRSPERGEYIPLVLALGREDFVKEILERRNEHAEQDKALEQIALAERGQPVDGGVVEMSPEELEAFMRGDTEADNTPEELAKLMKWGTPLNQMLLENLVLSKEDIGDDPLATRPARTIGQARRDMVEEIRNAEQKDLLQVKVVIDEVDDRTPDPKDKVRVVLRS